MHSKEELLEPTLSISGTWQTELYVAEWLNATQNSKYGCTITHASSNQEILTNGNFLNQN